MARCHQVLPFHLFTLVFLVSILPAILLARSRGEVAGRNLQREVTLSGRVFDSVSSGPIEGASIVVLGLGIGGSSDEKGNYRIGHIPMGKQTIICHSLGYTAVKIFLTFENDLKKDIQLIPSDINLPGVEVTGQRENVLPSSGKSATTLSIRDLEKERGQTLGATLQSVPGVTMLQTGPSISKPVIRGLHSERVVVINAGVPQEGQQWGGEHAPEIDPFAPARIEVVKGAAGVEYGAGAIGGVIKIEPRKLRESPGYAGMITNNGFSNNRQVAGSLLVEGAPDWLPGVAFQAQGSLRRAGDTKAPDYVTGNTGFSELDGAFTLGYKDDESSLQAYYSSFSTKLGIYRGSHIGSLSDLQRAINAGQPLTDYTFTYDIKPPEQDISHELLSVRGEHLFPLFGRVEIQFGRQSNHRQEFDAYRFFNNVQTLPTRAAFDLTLTTYSVDVKLAHNPIGSLYGTVGVSGTRQGNVGEGLAFLIPNFRAYSGALFVRESWTREAITIDAGARFDYRWMRIYPYEPKNIVQTDLPYANVSGALGMTYDLSSSWSVGAGLETAYRPPSINELFSNGVHHGTAQYERGDPTLRPERSYSFDATVRHIGATTRGEVSLFANSIRNFIFLFPDPDPVLTLRGAFPSFSYRQANSLLYGVDGYLDWHVIPAFTLQMTFSVVRGINNNTGAPLIQMPADRLRLTGSTFLPSSWIFQDPYIDLGGTFVWRQERYQQHVDYLDPPPGYALLDAGIGSDINIGAQIVRMNISVQNLLNARYRDYLSRFRYYVDEPGRDIILRLQIPIGQFEE